MQELKEKDGKFGEMKSRNTELISYGIQHEKSDFRIHVCPLVRRIYVFPTEAGKEAVQVKFFREAPAYTGSIKTAIGKLVPPGYIRECKCISLPDSWWNEADIQESESASSKGEKATLLVKRALSAGLIPISLSSEEVLDEKLQINGTDLIVSSTLQIQVKCDYKGGDSRLGGTGNLFLQTAECNPFQQH